jgi:putative endonuclease
MYYLYILRCSDNSLYCGQTKNLEKRIQEHNSSKIKSAKYTWSRRPVNLVYFEKHKNISEVLKREIEIKKYSKIRKEELIKLNTYEKKGL